jgi:hypothetical protein
MHAETYTARHTCDETGSRYEGDGPIDYCGHDLRTAAEMADDRTARGQCGYVTRESDGATLMPDGTWA